jgi:hypothetical protein
MSRDDLAPRFSSRVKPDQKVRMSLCIKLKSVSACVRSAAVTSDVVYWVEGCGLARKRRQNKHLDFDSVLLRTRRSGVRIPRAHHFNPHNLLNLRSDLQFSFLRFSRSHCGRNQKPGSYRLCYLADIAHLPPAWSSGRSSTGRHVPARI